MTEASPPAAEPPTIDLFLVDDHAMFREGLARILDRESGLRVVGQAASASAALLQLPSSGANLILLDVDLGPERALDFVAGARRLHFDGRILVLTAGLSGPEAVQLVQAGVAGIIHKHHSTEVLRDTIRQVAAGEAYMEKDYLPYLFRSVDGARSPLQPRLTDRDRTVLRFIFQGLTNKEIAGHLTISEGAVKASLRQLFEKLRVHTRAQLVKVALEQYRDQL